MPAPAMDAPQPAPAESHANTAVTEAGAAMASPASNQVLADTQRFEQRATRENLPPLEVTGAELELQRLTDASAKNPQAGEVAKALARELAEPTSINQGSHLTCTAASAEEILASKSPAEYSKMVADVALTGSAKLANGMVIQPDQNAVKADAAKPGEDAGRSASNAIAQTVLVDVGLAQRNANSTFVRTEPKHRGDTGDHVVDNSKTPPKVGSGNPSLRTSDVVAMVDAVTGKKNNATAIEYDDPNGAVPLGSGVTGITTEADLNKALNKLATTNGFPAEVSVNIQNEPFWTDNAGSMGGHAAIITGMKDGKVTIDTHWDGNKHLGADAIPVHDLYMSMRPATDDATINRMRTEVEASRKNGTVTASQELDLVRHVRQTYVMTEPQYRDAIDKTLSDANTRWDAQRKAGTFDQKDYDHTMKMLATMMVTTLHPNDESAALMARIKASNPEIKNYLPH